MKHMLKGAAVGLMMLGASSVAAAAADWHNGSGSIKDMRGAAAVPVPAPTPIPIYQPNWYLRLDGGVGLGGGRDASESGLTYGFEDSPGVTGPVPFGTRSSWLNSDFDTFVSLGGGVGFYWNDRFRTDLTVEAISPGKVNVNGVERYDMHGFDASVPPVYGRINDLAGDPTTQVNVYVDDVTKVSSVVSLFNAYYDLGKLHGVTPYIGAGIGVVMHHLNRSHTTTETTCDLTTVPECGAEVTRDSYTRATKQNSFALAAAVTAGLSYQMSDITALDVNYRYLHIGGTDMSMTITDNFGHSSQSKVTIGDSSEHQLRAGLRFDIR